MAPTRRNNVRSGMKNAVPWCAGDANRHGVRRLNSRRPFVARSLHLHRCCCRPLSWLNNLLQVFRRLVRCGQRLRGEGTPPHGQRVSWRGCQRLPARAQGRPVPLSLAMDTRPSLGAGLRELVVLDNLFHPRKSLQQMQEVTSRLRGGGAVGRFSPRNNLSVHPACFLTLSVENLPSSSPAVAGAKRCSWLAS